jgi:DNA repair exonuclease SbcCD nuclease subunit
MSNNDWSWWASSDWHLGHKKVGSAVIASNIGKYLDEIAPLICEVDHIFVAGDVFDHLLEWPSKALTLSTMAIYRLCCMAGKAGVKISVLEGTPSHDWRQSEIFLSFSDVCDISYHDTLSISNEADGRRFLFIPDEWRDTTEQTYAEVLELMQAEGLTKVDAIIMHGLFEHQAPVGIQGIQVHEAENYLALTDGPIHIGHHHTHSIEGRIVAQGSPERLTHGQEEEKGTVFGKMVNGEVSYKFTPNKHSTIFKTLKLNGKSHDDNFLIVKRELNKLTGRRAHIRLQYVGKSENILSLRELTMLYPQHIFTEQLPKTPQKETPQPFTSRDTGLHLSRDVFERVLSVVGSTVGTVPADMLLAMLRELDERVNN